MILRRDYTKRIGPLRDKNNQRHCFMCGAKFGKDLKPNEYVLIDEEWNRVASKIWPPDYDDYMMICADCTEKCLGRKIKAQDLKYMKSGAPLLMNLETLLERREEKVLAEYVKNAKGSISDTIKAMKSLINPSPVKHGKVWKYLGV